MAKISFKDKIDGNELDLSLNELVEVPVKELAASPKATHLDLSCNHIQILPSNFVTLTHLVKIDLSKNRLTELPHNFGNLVNLQYLDLYGNELKILPVSFCRLKNLRWLDLKNNPLDPKLKAIAGDCLDEKQCQACAKKVVSFMQNVDSDLEREKQKRLKEERDKEAVRKAQEQQELEELRKQKKAEREKRKAELKAKKDEMEKTKKTEQRKGDNGSMAKNGTLRENLETPQKSGSWWTWCFLLFFILPVTVLSVFIAFHLYNGYSINSVADLHLAVLESSVRLQEILILWWKAFLIPYSLSLKESIFEWLNSVSLFNSSLVL